MHLAGIVLWTALSSLGGITASPVMPHNDDHPTVGCLTMTSVHHLSGDEGFGGYSGMVLDQTKDELLLLADRGRLLRLSVALADNGAVLGVSGGEMLPIHDARGRPLSKRNGDTEALALWDGGYLITREGLDDALLITEVTEHFVIKATIADLSGGRALARNDGYEAATAIADGQALFISEGTLDTGEAMITYFDGEDVVSRGFYQPAEDFAVTDIFADNGGERLFAVERAFDRTLGPRTRLTVAPLADALDDDLQTLVPAELGRLGLADGTDNMEGIAFYRSSDGGESLMIISDDNFNANQRTVLMTFRLGDNCPL
ncbi:MAG: esterase-like activity of phytase family protein [Pseudomonadota bacterium]